MFRFDSRRRLFGGFKSQGLSGSFLSLHGLFPDGVSEQPFRKVDTLIWRNLGNRRLDILLAFRITSNNAPKFLAQRFDTRSENSYKFSTTSALTTLKISARIAPYKEPFLSNTLKRFPKK